MPFGERVNGRSPETPPLTFSLDDLVQLIQEESPTRRGPVSPHVRSPSPSPRPSKKRKTFSRLTVYEDGDDPLVRTMEQFAIAFRRAQEEGIDPPIVQVKHIVSKRTGSKRSTFADVYVRIRPELKTKTIRVVLLDHNRTPIPDTRRRFANDEHFWTHLNDDHLRPRDYTVQYLWKKKKRRSSPSPGRENAR